MSHALLRKPMSTLSALFLAHSKIPASSTFSFLQCSFFCYQRRSFANLKRPRKGPSKQKHSNTKTNTAGKKPFRKDTNRRNGNASFKKNKSRDSKPPVKANLRPPDRDQHSTNYVPPAMLLPTASKYAYVSTAAFSDLNEDEDPRELARSIFADVIAHSTSISATNTTTSTSMNNDDANDTTITTSGYTEPFAGASFEYFPPDSFQHELPTPNTDGSMTPEVAFLGRSNVGKSSLINSLMKKDLARCSKHPGRTQQPYYYGLVPSISYNQNKAIPTASQGFLVDLPGYGYANAPKKAVEHWQADTQDFLSHRRDTGCFRRLFLLIDARRGLGRDGNTAIALDLSVMRWMDEEEIPYTLVITKADCVSAPQLVKVANEGCIRYQQQHQAEMEQILYDNVKEEDVEAAGWMGPVVHITSAKKGEGIQELRSAVEAEFNFVD